MRGFVGATEWEETGVAPLPELLRRYVKVGMAEPPEGLRWYAYEGGGEWIVRKGERLHPLLPGSRVAFGDEAVWVDNPITWAFALPLYHPPPAAGGELGAILRLYNRVALPYRTGVIRAKADAIVRIAEACGRAARYDPDVGVVVEATSSPRAAVVCHMDLCEEFYAGFWTGRTLRLEGDRLEGALDNTLPNAVLLHLLESGRMPDDVTLVFTNDEERGSAAAYRFARASGLKAFLNLDVTARFKKLDASVEYDAPCAEVLSEVWGLLGTDRVGYTPHRDPDDMDALLRAGGNGFSFCLPTKKEIHSYRNRTTVGQVLGYSELLGRLLDNLPDLSRPRDLVTFSEKAAGCSREELLRQNEALETERSLLDVAEAANEAEDYDAPGYAAVLAFFERHAGLEADTEAQNAVAVFASWLADSPKVPTESFAGLSEAFDRAVLQMVDEGFFGLDWDDEVGECVFVKGTALATCTQ